MTKAKVLGTIYPDFHAALGAWADAVQPVQDKYGVEVNSQIFATPNGWRFTDPNSKGQKDFVNLPPEKGNPDEMYWGFIHTHPTDLQGLSNGDEWGAANSMGTTILNRYWNKADSGNGSAFVSLPGGAIYGWSPGMPIYKDGSPNFSQYIVRPGKTPSGWGK